MRRCCVCLLVLAACCLIFSRKARADVYAASDIIYYEPTNSMWIWAEARPSYGVLANYCIGHVSDVFKNDEQVDTINANSCDSVAYDEVFLPYDPSAEYTIVVNTAVDLRWQSAEGAGYNDVYGFVVWSNLDPVYSPNYFHFTGPGPAMDTWSNSISLGTVFSIFTEGARSGPPHHLKVISDDIVSGTCGRTERYIKYQIVDVNNRNAGRVPVKENVYNAPIYDSCSGLQVVTTSCTPWNPSNVINDELRVGINLPHPQCPNSIDPSCGYLFDVDRWQWCASDGPPVTLGTFTYDVRWAGISINGRNTPWPRGGYFYP